MEKEPEIGFTLQGIKLEQFAMFEENYEQKENIELNVKIEVKVNQIDKRIGIFLAVTYLHKQKVLVKIVVSCHFLISDDSWKYIMNDEEQSFLIPKGLLTHLAMLTIGTTRGILFAKTEGTIFSGFILPTIDVTEMLTEDMKLLIEPQHVETT